MTDLGLIIGVGNIFCGLIVVASSIPLLRGKVKMNRFFGLKFPRSYESDEAWYAINRQGAKYLILWSLVVIGIGVLAMLLPRFTSGKVYMILSLAPLVYLFAAWQSFRYSANYEE